MLGVLLAFAYITGKWLFGASIAQVAVPAFTFLLQWYILWAVIGAAYGVFSVVLATRKRRDEGCLSLIGAVVFFTAFAAGSLILQYGTLIWGASVLLGLVAGFSWWNLIGAIALILFGCAMQLLELIIWVKS